MIIRDVLKGLQSVLKTWTTPDAKRADFECRHDRGMTISNHDFSFPAGRQGLMLGEEAEKAL
jgi:hypothetical protein